LLKGKVPEDGAEPFDAILKKDLHIIFVRLEKKVSVFT